MKLLNKLNQLSSEPITTVIPQLDLTFIEKELNRQMNDEGVTCQLAPFEPMGRKQANKNATNFCLTIPELSGDVFIQIQADQINRCIEHFFKDKQAWLNAKEKTQFSHYYILRFLNILQRTKLFETFSVTCQQFKDPIPKCHYRTIFSIQHSFGAIDITVLIKKFFVL